MFRLVVKCGHLPSGGSGEDDMGEAGEKGSVVVLMRMAPIGAYI